MAAPSPWQSPFSSAATTSLQSSTIIPICYTNRRLLIPWSSDFYSPSSCCCSVKNAPGKGRKRLRVKPVELITVDGDSETGKAFDSPFNSGGFNDIRLSFKSLFGKRALWRRIFFASKKVRSIIMLNAITIIYGTATPVYTWFGALFVHCWSSNAGIQWITSMYWRLAKLFKCGVFWNSYAKN